MIHISYDDLEKTEDQMAGKPWNAKVVHVVEVEETHEQHIFPDEGRKLMVMSDDPDHPGQHRIQRVSQKHEPSPTCFCQPFMTLANEYIWIHRK